MKMVVDGKQQYFPEFADLLAQLDHDVRSPLTAICGYAECLGWLSVTDATSRERYAATIIGQARRLARLIANAATLSAQQEEGAVEELDLAHALDEALQELSPMIGLQEATLKVRTPAATVNVLWPRASLQRLLLATLESVFDAAGDGAAAEVEIEQAGQDVVLTVSATSDAPVSCANSFAFRAAARLVGARGGSLLLGDGGQPHLRLRLPACGQVAAPGMRHELERSA